MAVSLQLLGQFAVHDETGAALSLPTRKSCALLAYLAVNADRPQSRDQLVALFWGDRGERQARQSLSHALRSIRRLDPAGDATLLENDGEHVTLRIDAMDIDVVRFRALLGEHHTEAAALYDGPFLDGLSIPSSQFEAWLAATRAELHDLACDALQRAASAAAATGNGQDAIDAAKRLVRLDPVRESGHQLLIRLLCENGDRASALRQYQVCADILQKELGVEPGPATRMLRDAILKDPHASQIGDAPQAADAPALRPVPFASPPHSLPERRPVAAVLAGALMLFGVTMIPWQLPWTERTVPVPQPPPVTALPDSPAQVALTPKRFADIAERDTWYAAAKRAVEDIFDRRLASQNSDWDTLDCDTITTRNARWICKDIALEIQWLEQQKARELDALGQELALTVVSPPEPVAPMMNVATNGTAGDAADSKVAPKPGIDLVAIPMTDPVTPEPVTAQPLPSDKTTPGELGRDHDEKSDAGLETPEIATALAQKHEFKPIVQDNGHSETVHTRDTVKPVGVADKRKAPPARMKKAQAKSIVALPSATKRKAAARTTIMAKETPDKPTASVRKEKQRAEVTRTETEQRPEPKAAAANKSRALATRPALTAQRGGLVQSREEIERHWRERIEAVKREGYHKECWKIFGYSAEPAVSCRERAEKIKEYSAALKSGRPFFDLSKAIAALQANPQSRAEIERHWRARIEAVKAEGPYKDCDISFYTGSHKWRFIDDCKERAERVEKYTAALKSGRPFFDPKAIAALQARRQSRAEIERHWRERIEAAKAEGPYKDCRTAVTARTDGRYYRDECQERAERIKEYLAALKSGRSFFDPNEAISTLITHSKSRAAFERYVRQRVEKLKRVGPYEDCDITVVDAHIDPAAFTECEERGEEIQKLWAMLYTGKVPGKFAIAIAPGTPDSEAVASDTEQSLLRQAIVAYYLSQGYSNDPGPISNSFAGISDVQVKSMRVREVDGNRFVVATQYDAETQDDFEVFSLASDFTLVKENGVYRVVGHDPSANQM